MGRKTDGAATTSQMGVLPSTDEVLQNAGPFGQQLGLGSIAGYAAGVAVRTTGTLGFALAGGAFIALQSLQYKGYISVDWHKVEREMTAYWDSDGDGRKLTAGDVRAYWEQVTDILAFGVPGGAGFSLGLAYGLGGGLGRLLAGGAALGVGAPLVTSHLYANYEEFRTALERTSPALGEKLRRHVLAPPEGPVRAGGGTSGGGLAGDAAWRWSMRRARDDLEKLRRLEREVRTGKGEGGGRGGGGGGGGGLDRSTVRARLREIEERKKEVKKAAKAAGRKS